MKYQENLLDVFRLAILVCLLLCSGVSSNKVDLEQAIEHELRKNQLRQTNQEKQITSYDGYHHLKRKRRYLEFPEGSSFQLVYDLIVGVVDFTNYLILGVTVALAWELPSKPPSEIFNDLSERLKDGTLGTSRKDSVENIKYFDVQNVTTTNKTATIKYKFHLKPVFRPPMHFQYYTPQTHKGHSKSANNFYIQNSRIYSPQQYKKHNLYYTRKQTHPFTKWAQHERYPKFKVKGTQYPWWNLPERLKNSFAVHPSIRRFDKNINFGSRSHMNKVPPRTQSTFQDTGRSEHRIYPVFGKRSVCTDQPLNKPHSCTHNQYKHSAIATELPSKLDRIHIEHHRRTRHDLYQRIETFLNGRGSHGHHCVLKALCETGQKSDELQPGSFVGELMRAIFTIPEPVDASLGEKEHAVERVLRYDAANALKQDCSRRYTHCKESLWSSHFVL